MAGKRAMISTAIRASELRDARDEMAAFDELPREVRQAIALAPFCVSARRVARRAPNGVAAMMDYVDRAGYAAA